MAEGGTGSEPRRLRVGRWKSDGACRIHQVCGERLKPGDLIEVVEVGSGRHDEQTEARKNIERMRELTDEVARLNARIQQKESER